MNHIKKSPVQTLGYNFIGDTHIPKGKDEYYLRNQQNNSGIQYRRLTAYEIEALVRNRNTSDDWNKILVNDAFNPELVQNCKFFGLVRIGKLEPYYLEFHNLRRPVGLYNSTIISCDFGNNVVVDNVNYISHYIVGSDVILVNVNEIATTEYAKFGNGILKEDEPESKRVWMEICNENAGRSIIPFDGMLPGDAYLWTRFRDNNALQEKFVQFTDRHFSNKRGFYGSIGDRTVVKNCRILKDVNIGSDAYLKGANKIKNVTINSTPDAVTQIGEGCELVNGIIEHGCRIFYGVKAVRFVLASHSQLKYGARLINSYLGNNSTISCCEVLNSLIFPAHEQHHNNSFLCAALVSGQSNMAAGATIGSNHNSRSPDGEIIAGRGFWPGLCVSLKHNSKFACYTILAKGDYPAELNITIPFSLVSNDVSKDQLIVMPGYWFMYNMYALARNSWKYTDRDKRIVRTQNIEYHFLAPDTINEMKDSLTSFELFTGRALHKQSGKKSKISDSAAIELGKQALLSKDPQVEQVEILADGFENTNRNVKLVKVTQAYHLFLQLIRFHATSTCIEFIKRHKIKSWQDLKAAIPTTLKVNEWDNIGGQLVPKEAVQQLTTSIVNGRVKNWNMVHEFYQKQATLYEDQKWLHALAILKEVTGLHLKKADYNQFCELLSESVEVKTWMAEGIYESRAKDYQNEFRKMVYGSTEEMNIVVGDLKKNSFINQEKAALESYKKQIQLLIKKLK